MIGELQDYIAKKGWDVRPVTGGRQLLLKDPCPFCGKPGKLYFNPDNGLWHCKTCTGEESGGNLLTMRRRLGDLEPRVLPAHMVFLGPKDQNLSARRPADGLDQRCHDALAKEPDALDYLRRVRGFSDETIERFNLGYAEKSGKRLVSIPFYVDGELVNMKFRTLPPEPKAFRRVNGCPSTLFNQDALRGLDQLPAQDRVAFVLESETDCMALVQLGCERSVASSAGAGSWQETWLRPLEDATEVYLVYDNDEAGEAGAAKAADMLGRYRCKRVLPALHDVAEMLAAGMTSADMTRCIEQARPYDDGSLKPSSAFAAALKAKLASPKPRGRPTGWLSLDELWGGVRDCELTVVTGDTGSGKSTWTTAFALNRLLLGEPVLIAPFEMRPDEVLGKLVSMQAGRSVFDLTLLEVDTEIAEACKHPLYWLDCYGSLPLQKLKDAIYVAVRRYGVRFVVLDHLHFFLDVKRASEERYAIDQTVRALKSWAMDLRVHIFLVVHPHKLGEDEQGRTRRPDLDHLKGSSEIKKTCDNGFRVHRHRSENRTGRAEATITVLKCRSPAGTEGSTYYAFDRDSETYTEKAPPKGRRARSKGAGDDDPSPDDTPEIGWEEPY